MARKSILGTGLALALMGCAPGTEHDATLTVDRMAIENVMHDYVLGLDSGDMEVYLATLADDAEFHAEGVDYVGKQAITDYVAPVMTTRRESLASGEGMGATHHIVTNQALSFSDAENAAMRSYWMFAIKGEDGISVSLMGSSEDHFVKRDGKWLIRERIVTTL